MTAGSLRQVIELEAPMRPAQAIGIAIGMLESLTEMHLSGRAHNEIAPENVRLHRGGVELRAPSGHADARYVAPELNESTESPRADVYSVACVLYELLTRTLPEPGAPPPSSRTPSPLGARLEAAVMRALDPSPAARFADARELLQELRVCLVDALGTAARSSATATRRET